MGVHQKQWDGEIVTVPEDTIITVKEARKILGKEYADISDDNIQRVVNSLHKISDYLLSKIIVPNKAMVQLEA